MKKMPFEMAELELLCFAADVITSSTESVGKQDGDNDDYMY